MEEKKSHTVSKNLNVYSGTAEQIVFFWGETVAKPASHRLHISRFCEAYVFLGGDCGYIVEGNYSPLKRGDVVIIQPNEIHKAVIHSDCWYSRCYITVPVNAFGYFAEGVPSPLDCFLNRNFGENNFISPPESERMRVLSLLEYLRDTEDMLKCHAALLDFLVLLNELSAATPSAGSGTPEPRRQLPQLMIDVLGYINERYMTIESVESVAERFYISAPYLSSLFKKSINVNISKYIMMKRLAYSKVLLNAGSSVTEACFGSGFNNCSYYIESFRQVVGVTPNKYKKLCGNGHK